MKVALKTVKEPKKIEKLIKEFDLDPMSPELEEFRES